MEQSQTIINNITNNITNVNVTFFIAGGGTGFLLTVFGKIGFKRIDEYFEKRKALWQRKCRLADKIIEVCTEGSTVAYNALPGSQRYIHNLANLVEGFDKSVAEDLRKYLGIWLINAIPQTSGKYKNNNPSLEDIKFASENQKAAKELEDRILASVRGWR